MLKSSSLVYVYKVGAECLLGIFREGIEMHDFEMFLTMYID
jgi:hypothetical protein